MAAPEPRTDGKVRVDKWLWAARCFKTRTQAGKACDGGHCKVNGESAKASQKVGVGDSVEVVTPGGRRVLEVVALADRRGPASVAEQLFVDHTPPPPAVEKDLGLQVERGQGRPSKRDRRRYDKVRGW